MKPQIHTFKNGLRLVVVPMPSAQTVTALVLVGTGSLYESNGEQGLSHFLEHMCFKGTTRRPTARVIAEELDSIGAISNAFTSYEYTGYYAKGAPEHAATFIDVLSDTYLHSTFPEIEIEKEKGVIVEEINMYEDMLSHKAGEVLAQLMFGDTPQGRSIAGTPQTVRAFTRDDFVAYKKAHYHSTNTVIAVAGPVEMKTIRALVETYFVAIDTAKNKSRAKIKVSKVEQGTMVVAKPSDQTHIAIGFHSVPFRHKDAAVVSLLGTILGRGMSSRLFLLLREELGVAYYVQAEQESFKDYGVFAIVAGIDTARASEVFSRIANELKIIRTVLVDEIELTKAKEYTLGMLRMGLESSDDVAIWYGMPIVLGKDPRTPAEVIKEYRSVTALDIRRVAAKIFTAMNAHVAVVGAAKEADIVDFRSLL